MNSIHYTDGVIKRGLYESIYVENDIISMSQLCNRDSVNCYTEDIQMFSPPSAKEYSEKNCKSRTICEIPSCNIIGPAGCAFTNDRDIIIDTTTGDLDFFFHRISNFFNYKLLINNLIHSEQRTDDCELPEYVFPLLPFYDSYYYHWMVEYLPKIRMLETYERKSGNEPIILVESNPPQFVPDTLSLLGYSSERIVEWKSENGFVDNLIVTNHRPHSILTGIPRSANDYYWLRERVKSQICGLDKSSGKKIYISRQKSKRGRRVNNYGRLMNELKIRGFDSVNMEALCQEEQVKIMSEADIIVSPHGAGLVNMLFANNPKIIELLPENYTRPHFRILAEVLGFEYTPIKFSADYQSNLNVDVNKISEELDKIS